MISSSDHDSDGNIKKTHIPFEQKGPVTFDFKGKVIKIVKPKLK